MPPPRRPPSSGVDRGDADRFTELFERTHRPLLAYAVRRVTDPADAADVVAETFVVAWRRIGEVPSPGDDRPWLYGVARRVLANHHRGERRRDALADRLRDSLTEVSVPGPEPRDISPVTRALATLGPGDQEILRLLAWEELTHEEIAVALGISRGSVRVRLHRARARLANAMTAQGEEKDAGVQRHTPAGHVVSGRRFAPSDAKELS
ncbi:MAG: RNA polymerase sigma factor [Tetrasphaera sp.]